MIIQTVVFTIISTLVLSTAFAVDPCRFEDPEKGVIDLTSLGRVDGIPAYQDEVPFIESNHVYSCNPCRSFSPVSNNGQEMRTLETQESASRNPGSDVNNLPSINCVYENKKATDFLQCSSDGNNEFQAFGEDPVNTFRFQFTHKCACWNGCSSR